MTQEYFLPKLANQEVNQQLVTQVFQEYEEINQKWPWQSAVEFWVDYILGLATKPWMMSVYLDPLSTDGGKISFRVDGRVISGVNFTATQYSQLIKAIQNCAVSIQSITAQYFQEGYICAENGQKHWVGFLQTITGIQVTLSFDYDLLSQNVSNQWSKQAQIAIEKMQNHPNGLIVCCHRTSSVSRQDVIYQIFNSLANRINNETRIGCITESLQSQPTQQNITRLCVDGSLKSWQQASRALINQDIDLVMMRGSNEQEVVSQAVLTALEDRYVLVDVAHLSAIDTLLWLFNDLTISPSQVASILVGVVGSYASLRKVCPHCCIERQPDELLLEVLQQQDFTSKLDGKWVQGKGCPECWGTGYLPGKRLTVVEAVYLDRSLVNICLSKPSRDTLKSALSDCGFQTYMEQALDFARKGMTTLDEAIRVGLARRCEL